MKRFILAILCGFSLWANGAILPNRFTTNVDGALINGGTLTNILRAYITPFDCGAVGDGVTDDAVALKRWLFIGCSSNWICFLPPAPGGSYACSTTLLVTNGMNHVNIRGPGGAAFNSDGPSQNFALINITAQVDGLRITNSPSNVSIEGIRLTNSAAYVFSTHGIWFDGNVTDSDCASVRNCSAQGFGRGLMLSSVADTTVENCSFGVGGMGIEIARGTYANPPIINQVRISGCQLSYNYTNQLHITNAGQYVLVQSCDMSAQVGAVGPTVAIERNAYVTLSDMHLEPYNSKPCIVVTDNGGGAGGTFLNVYNVACSLDGTTPGANTYSIVATNANVTLMNVGLSDVADGSFSMLWNGDINVLTSDKSILSRMVAAANIGTNYLGGNFIRAKNSGVVGTYIREGEFLREFADYNNAPGGGIGGGYILSHLYYGLRQFDNDGSLGTVAVNLGGYYEDRTANGTGIPSTNGFRLTDGANTKFNVASSGIVTNSGLVVRSNTPANKPTLIGGDMMPWTSNGVPFLEVADQNATKSTNIFGAYMRATVSGSDATTTGQSLVDVTGLSIALSTNAVYDFEAVLSVSTTAVTTGTKYAVQYSVSGATVEAQIVASLTTTASASERISALNTATANAYLTTSAQSGQVLIKGVITTGVNSGNLTIQHLKVTSGTSTVLQKSVLKATRVS